MVIILQIYSFVNSELIGHVSHSGLRIYLIFYLFGVKSFLVDPQDKRQYVEYFLHSPLMEKCGLLHNIFHHQLYIIKIL